MSDRLPKLDDHCALEITCRQRKYEELRGVILRQTTEEDMDVGRGIRTFQPRDVIVSLAASAPKGAVSNDKRNERKRTLEILGLYEHVRIHGCPKHPSRHVLAATHAQYGDVDFISLKREGTDAKDVGTLASELGSVYLRDINDPHQDPYARRLFSDERPCPECRANLAELGNPPGAVPKPCRLSHIYSLPGRECFFLEVGAPDGRRATPIPQKLKIFGRFYFLRAAIFQTSGGLQFVAQVHLHGCWHLYNDMVSDGKLRHVHSYDTDFMAGSEHTLMYVRDDIVYESRERRRQMMQSSQQGHPGRVSRGSPHATTTTSAGGLQPPASGASSKPANSGADTKQVRTRPGVADGRVCKSKSVAGGNTNV